MTNTDKTKQALEEELDTLQKRYKKKITDFDNQLELTKVVQKTVTELKNDKNKLTNEIKITEEKYHTNHQQLTKLQDQLKQLKVSHQKSCELIDQLKIEKSNIEKQCQKELRDFEQKTNTQSESIQVKLNQLSQESSQLKCDKSNLESRISKLECSNKEIKSQLTQCIQDNDQLNSDKQTLLENYNKSIENEKTNKMKIENSTMYITELKEKQRQQQDELNQLYGKLNENSKELQLMEIQNEEIITMTQLTTELEDRLTESIKRCKLEETKQKESEILIMDLQLEVQDLQSSSQEEKEKYQTLISEYQDNIKSMSLYTRELSDKLKDERLNFDSTLDRFNNEKFDLQQTLDQHQDDISILRDQLEMKSKNYSALLDDIAKSKHDFNELDQQFKQVSGELDEKLLNQQNEISILNQQLIELTEKNTIQITLYNEKVQAIIQGNNKIELLQNEICNLNQSIYQHGENEKQLQSMNKDTSMKLENALVSITNYQSKLSTAQKELDSLYLVIQDLKSVQDQCNTDHDKQFDQLKQDHLLIYQKFENSIDQLKSTISKLTNEKSTLSCMLDDYNSRIDILVLENSEISKKNQDLTEIIKERSNTIDTLKSDIGKLTRDNNNHCNEIDGMKFELTQLTTVTIPEKDNEINEKRESISSLQSQISVHTESIKSNQQIIHQHLNTIDEKSFEITKTQQELSLVKQQSDQQQQSIQSLTGELSKFKQDLNLLQSQYNEKLTTIDEINITLSATSNELSEKNAIVEKNTIEISNLVERLDTVKLNYKNLNQEYEADQNQLEKCKLDLELSVSLYNESKSYTSQLEKSIEQVKQVNQEQSDHQSQLTMLLDEERYKCSSLKLDLENYKNQFQNASESIDYLNKQIEKYKLEINESYDTISEFKLSTTQFEKTVCQLSLELKEITSLQQDTADENQLLNQRISNLTNQIQDSTDQIKQLESTKSLDEQVTLNKISELTEQNRELESIKFDNQLQLDSLNKKFNQLQDKYNEITTQLKNVEIEYHNKSDSLNSKLKLNQQELDDYQLKFNDSINTISIQSTTIQEKDEMIIDFKNELLAKDSKLQSLSNESQCIQQDLDDYKLKFNESTNTISIQSITIQEKDEMIIDYINELQVKESKIQSLSNESNLTLQELDECKLKINESNNTISAQSITIQEKDEMITDYKNELLTSESKLKSLSKESEFIQQDLKSQLQVKIQENEILIQESDKLKSKYEIENSELQTTISKLTNQLSEIESKVIGSNENISQMEYDKQKIHQEIDSIKQQLSIKQNEFNLLKQDFDLTCSNKKSIELTNGELVKQVAELSTVQQSLKFELSNQHSKIEIQDQQIEQLKELNSNDHQNLNESKSKLSDTLVQLSELNEKIILVSLQLNDKTSIVSTLNSKIDSLESELLFEKESNQHLLKEHAKDDTIVKQYELKISSIEKLHQNQINQLSLEKDQLSLQLDEEKQLLVTTNSNYKSKLDDTTFKLSTISSQYDSIKLESNQFEMQYQQQLQLNQQLQQKLSDIESSIDQSKNQSADKDLSIQTLQQSLLDKDDEINSVYENFEQLTKKTKLDEIKIRRLETRISNLLQQQSNVANTSTTTTTTAKENPLKEVSNSKINILTSSSTSSPSKLEQLQSTTSTTATQKQSLTNSKPPLVIKRKIDFNQDNSKKTKPFQSTISTTTTTSSSTNN